MIIWFTLVLSCMSAFSAPHIVIGKDSRVQILKHEDPIIKTIGQVEFDTIEKKPNGVFKRNACTGTLITKRHVITNGHCVTASNKYPSPLTKIESMTFSPGRLKGYEIPFGQFKVKQIHTFKRWIMKGDIKWDVAVLTLDRDAYEPEVSVDEFRESDFRKGEKLHVIGYPGDKPDGTLWKGEGTFLKVESNGNVIQHSVDTYSGTSGSLLMKRIGNVWVPVGVHRGSQSGIFNDHNSAVMFNSEIIRYIRKWTSQD